MKSFCSEVSCSKRSGQILLVVWLLGGLGLWGGSAMANGNVHVTRFWHNHQPIYWPEWNSGVGQDSRVQYAHDSMRLKPTQNYGAPWNHPHNDLEQIFGNDDRIAAYQGRPRDSVSSIGQAGGMAMSYTGSLIDNVRNLAANGWNYGNDWNSGNTQARQWTTPSGSPRLDMVGFSYHHSLTPLLPKEVFRKEVQMFKQAWWKAWGGNMDLSDHSKGFFPTEMAYSRDIIDVLVDEGYDWVIVASHHISRTSPSYNDRVNPGSFNIKSSPPNRADQLGPLFPNASQWWFDEPNPGQAAWNVSPFAYQLHRVKYIDPETGAEKTMIAVPSDDVISYQAGYSGAQIGAVDSHIAPHANDPNRPVLVMPATDGDNAWGGGFDSWMVSTPAFFGAAESRGYQITTIQDFVNQFGAHAPTTHIEEGAWIYPEVCYGSPYFLKWIEPPVRTTANSPTTYPNTVIDVENGWSLKFFAYAPKMAGANWVITAEQIWRDEGGTVEPWKIQAPYDWDGTWTNPNVVELAWHIYLKGLDSGFQYYGGLGNDDEVKPGLAARRAIETLESYMSSRLHLDQTGPTILKPQRFPYNPGGWTFGWFNNVPGGDSNWLKQMPSEFYIWSLVHDVSGVQNVDLMIRRDKDGVRSLANNHNETYAGGSDVEEWIRIPMTRRILPNTRAELNQLANHGEIDYVVTSPEIADQYFVKLDDNNLPGFRDNLFDYYIEATDTHGNISRSEIQHVYVEDDGVAPSSGVQFSADPRDCAPLTVTYNAANGPLEGISPVVMQISFDGGSSWTPYTMSSSSANVWTYTIDIVGKPTSAIVWFENSAGTITDSRNGQNWTTSIRDCDAPTGPRIVQWIPENPDGCDPVSIRYFPNEGMLQGSAQINIHIGRNGWSGPQTLPMTQEGIYWEFIYTPPPGTDEINFVFNNGTDWDNNNGNDWHVTVTNCDDGPPPPTGLAITNPESDIVVDNAVDSYDLEGIAEGIDGDLDWTNALTGASGSLAATTPWTIAGLALGVGDNDITVSGTLAGSGGSVTLAEDSAENYSDWTDGSNQGSGFLPWNLSVVGSEGGHFLGGAGWGFWSHEGGNTSEAFRPLGSPLAVGQTFHVYMQNGWIWEDGGSVGVALRNAGGDTLWELFFNGGDPTYMGTDGVTDIGWTDSGLNISFTLTGASSYEATVHPAGSSARQYTGTISGGPITEFRAWSHDNGTGDGQNSNRDFFVNDLAITEVGNGEGVVTSATVRITREAAGDGDSNGDGVPDQWYLDNGYDPTIPDLAQQMGLNGHPLGDSFQLNLDPNDPDSTMHVEHVRLTPTGMLEVDWVATDGRRYVIQHTPDLSAVPFADVTGSETDVPGAGSNRVHRTTDMGAPGGAGMGHYRVRFMEPLD